MLPGNHDENTRYVIEVCLKDALMPNILNDDQFSLSMLMNALNTLDLDMVIVDRNMRVVWSNVPTVDKYSYCVLENKYCYEVFRDADRICDGCLVARTFETEEPQSGTWMASLPNSATLCSNVSTAPLVAKDGKVAYVLEIINDVTATSRAESELERYKRLVNNSHDFMLISDENFSVCAANRKLIEDLGYDEDDLIGSKCDILFSSEEMHKYEMIIEKAHAVGIAMDSVHLTKKNGEIIPAQVFCAWDNNHKVYETVFHDISERLRMEDELRKRSEQLQKQNKQVLSVVEERNRFFRNVSHELRTPLTSIIGFAELMLEDLDEPLTKRQLMQMERIAGNGHKLLRLVNDLLDLSKIEADKMNIGLSPLNISEFLKQIIDSMIPLAHNKDLAVWFEMQTDIKEIATDEEKLGQIMVNLISNAVKFTNKGSVDICVRNDERSIRISVKDSGIGIAENELSEVFKEFYQGSTRQVPGQRGTGLGLAIALKLAHLLGGQLFVESEIGVGSVFTLELPISTEN